MLTDSRDLKLLVSCRLVSMHSVTVNVFHLHLRKGQSQESREFVEYAPSRIYVNIVHLIVGDCRNFHGIRQPPGHQFSDLPAFKDIDHAIRRPE
jgi:hypothetical protein